MALQVASQLMQPPARHIHVRGQFCKIEQLEPVRQPCSVCRLNTALASRPEKPFDARVQEAFDHALSVAHHASAGNYRTTWGERLKSPTPQFHPHGTRFRQNGSSYFFSSTSTYSASMTPSSFFCSPAGAPPSGCPGAPPAGGCEALALYSTSASLWLALVSFSLAAFSSLALGVPSRVFLASARADSTSPFSGPWIFSSFYFSIFSML